MPEDASLDEFLETEADASEQSSSSDTDEEAEDADTPVAPATTTYAWSPDGGACADCGAVVERRWDQGGALVCPDCKDWDR